MDLVLLAKLGGGAASILWIIAVVLVIAGIVLIIVGCLVGPGEYGIFK